MKLLNVLAKETPVLETAGEAQPLPDVTVGDPIHLTSLRRWNFAFEGMGGCHTLPV